ncbi:cytochrome P450 4g15 isoform X2 [Halyomorpha halys]
MIAPTFHLNVLKGFMDDFNRNSKHVIERMSKENGKMFDCHEYMSEIMVETLLETVMGVKQEFKNGACFSYAHSVIELCHILHYRHIRPWYRQQFIFKLTNMSKEWDRNLQNIFKLTNKVFKIKKEDCSKNRSDHSKLESTLNKPVKKEVKGEDIIETQSDGKFSYGQAAGLKDDIDADENEIGEKKRLPFLESLIDQSQNGDKLTDQDIIDQINTIMFEGHDTTAAVSSFFLCVMAARQDLQEKCIEEINSIFGDSERPVIFQDTLEMKYLEKCIMETLRLFPPVPIIARELEQEVPIKSENLILPKGSAVVICPFKIHRRPDIYPDPETFDPDRFLPQNAVNRHYYSFLPFSAGPRGCVGRKYAMLKLKILLANILRKFHIKPGKPIKDWKLQGDIILKRSDKFEIAIELRRTQNAC